MVPNPRVIVTGARDWTNKLMVIGALNDVYTHYGRFTLIHGHCPTGADQIANSWYMGQGPFYCEAMERYAAWWDIDGNAAGPRRNARMVRQGAGLGLAFPLGDSRGTWDCVNKMRAAKIPIRIYDFKSGLYRSENGQVPE